MVMATKKERIRNAIAFFALEHEKLVHEPLGVDLLRRYLASLGYRSFEGERRSVLSLLHIGMRRSQLVVDIDGKPTKMECDSFSLVSHDGTTVVEATRPPDLDCFSPFELLKMKKTVQVAASCVAGRVDRDLDIREARRRMVWVGGKVDEDCYAAIDAPSEKLKEVDAMSGLQLLTEKYVTELKELETRMADIKRKLEVVMEASRLLTEEGLPEDSLRAS